MRKGCHVRNNDPFHLHCIDSTSDGYRLGNFEQGVIVYKFENVKKLVKAMCTTPDLFFCKSCELFMFHQVEYMSNEDFELPSTDIWPECTHLNHSFEINEYNFVTIHTTNKSCNYEPLKWVNVHDSNIPDEQ